MNKALFLDLDGTVRETKSGRVAPNEPGDQVVLPGRVRKINEYKAKGYKIIAVSNQAGVALKHLSHSDVKRCLFSLNEDMGRPFDEMLYCAAHPDANDPRRKPNPGMLLEAAERHNIDLKKSIMVGDMLSDRKAAEAAGVKFKWANEFFNQDQIHDKP